VWGFSTFKGAIMSEDSKILARLDERTKYIKEKLDEHIQAEADEKLVSRVSTLETNVSWIRRLGIGIPSTIAALFGTWKGFS
jgi:hypothetical protein